MRTPLAASRPGLFLVALLAPLPFAAAGCRAEEPAPPAVRGFVSVSSGPVSGPPAGIDSGAAVGASAGAGVAAGQDASGTYGAIGRARNAQIETELQAILESTLPLISSLLADLDRAVEALVPPPHLATTDPVLKTWHQAERDGFQSKVDALYAEAGQRLAGLQDEALAQARTRASQQAGTPSPLDEGATGDPAIETALQTFEEVVRGAVGLEDLEDRHGHDRRRRVDLFEVFSSFGSPETESAMGGRLLLFVGGDETSGSPGALLAFRCDDGSDPGSRRFVQVFRHRILRGGTIVKDLGWRPAPVARGADGRLRSQVLETFALAPDCEPIVDTTAAGYQQLRDMRIVVDVQSAVVDGAGGLTGGVDWRLEFQVSARGDLTWQLGGGKPVFDKYCTEAKALPGS